ncbi:MAG: DEAD/DEAH box helicase, partial [Candidatus Aminicenantes bacterium]|nr:DEAD/DEAH box helicase [Candidatus Aminicenantes bacterium]
RLLVKECLRRAFKESGIRWWHSPRSKDVHGEFGYAANDDQSDWNKNREKVIFWLSSEKDEQKTIIRALTGADNQEYLEWLESELPVLIDDIVANPEISAEGLAEQLAEGAVLPMFGMPSRTRNLYHRLSRGKESVIDRDLELAITEFAPGAQKTKDKAVLTSIGFTAPIFWRGNRWVLSSEKPLQYRRWMMRCTACGETSTSEEKVSEEICPRCRRIEYFHQFQIAVPQAFRTDLTKGDDAADESDVSFGMPGILAESSGGITVDALPGKNCSTSFSDAGRVWRINDNIGRFFEGTITHTPPPPADSARRRGAPSLVNQWIDTRYLDNIESETEIVALAAGKTTEVLRIFPETVPRGLMLDPARSQSAVRAAVISAAFLLQRVLADSLDIDPDEIEIANIGTRRTDAGNDVAEIILSDRLANGSGFVRWARDNLSDILAESCYPEKPCSYAGLIYSDDHRSCDSACYDCLKVYRNMSYHGLLDWRLAVSYIKILLSSDYKAGLDGNFNSPELEGWLKTVKKLLDFFISNFPDYRTEQWDLLPGFVAGERKFVIVHPLWDISNPEGILADAIEHAGGHVDGFIDTFNLLRRPPWCREQIARIGVQNE